MLGAKASPSGVQTPAPTVQEPGAHAAQAPASLPVPLPHDSLRSFPLTGCQLLDILIVQGQSLGLIGVQLWDGTVVPDRAPKWTLLVPEKAKQPPLPVSRRLRSPGLGRPEEAPARNTKGSKRTCNRSVKCGLSMRWNVIQFPKGGNI